MITKIPEKMRLVYSKQIISSKFINRSSKENPNLSTFRKKAFLKLDTTQPIKGPKLRRAAAYL